MATLKSYAELGTVYRTAPCVEYPGCWLVCTPKHLEDMGYGSIGAHTLEEAQAAGSKLLDKLEADLVEYNPRDISVCWEASDNDPRVGQVWFTGFYKLGHFNHYGHFRTV